MTDRYDTSNNVEGQYQPGSNDLVLLNKLGITDPADMDDVELELLEQLYDYVLNKVEVDQSLAVSDICEWHRNGFQFAAVGQIPRLLKTLDKDFLSVYTPCSNMSDEELIDAIAVIHIEFILIHPFREGNGRIARLLANVMALQADKPELDFSFWDKEREKYFSAIQAGMSCNYEPLKDLVRQVIQGNE